MISIVIPAYNAADTIEGCLQSLLNQTVPQDKYEILVVNDGSTDKTAEIVQSLGVKCLTQKNKGPAAARNLGAMEATGDIILFTDSDCVANKDWVKEMKTPFENPIVMGVKGRYKTHQREMVARFVQMEFEERYELQMGTIPIWASPEKHEFIDFVDSYSAAFRKDAFWDVGGFDESFPKANNEDVDLSYKLSSKGYKMVFNPEAVVYHRHPNSLRRYFKTKLGRGYWRMFVYKRFPRKAIKDSYTPQSLKLQILLFYLSLASLSGLFLGFKYLPIPTGFLFLLTMIPFSLRALRKDIRVGLLSPFFLTLRAVAIGIGAIAGFFYRPRQASLLNSSALSRIG